MTECVIAGRFFHVVSHFLADLFVGLRKTPYLCVVDYIFDYRNKLWTFLREQERWLSAAGCVC